MFGCKGVQQNLTKRRSLARVRQLTREKKGGECQTKSGCQTDLHKKKRGGGKKRGTCRGKKQGTLPVVSRRKKEQTFVGRKGKVETRLETTTATGTTKKGVRGELGGGACVDQADKRELRNWRLSGKKKRATQSKGTSPI